MIARRSLLLAGAASGLLGQNASAALPVPRGNALAFRVMRHGSTIGTHALAFRRNGDDLDVEISVEVLVKFGPIPFVRYAHHNREAWHGNRLAGATARTDRNGKKLQMAAQRTSTGLAVEGTGTKPYVAPDNALPTSYWNSRMLLGPMIGTQDGSLTQCVVKQYDPEVIRLASGEGIYAKRYRLSGDLDLELWYDATDTWAGMRFTADDGSIINYERL